MIMLISNRQPRDRFIWGSPKVVYTAIICSFPMKSFLFLLSVTSKPLRQNQQGSRVKAAGTESTTAAMLHTKWTNNHSMLSHQIIIYNNLLHHIFQVMMINTLPQVMMITHKVKVHLNLKVFLFKRFLNPRWTELRSIMTGQGLECSVVVQC